MSYKYYFSLSSYQPYQMGTIIYIPNFTDEKTWLHKGKCLPWSHTMRRAPTAHLTPRPGSQGHPQPLAHSAGALCLGAAPTLHSSSRHTGASPGRCPHRHCPQVIPCSPLSLSGPPLYCLHLFFNLCILMKILFFMAASSTGVGIYWKMKWNFIIIFS